MTGKHPRQPSGFSLRALVGAGFAVVALILGLATASVVINLQSFSDRSERLLSSGVATTRLIEQLAERITEVERAARQYSVVGSPNLLQIYREREQALLETMSTLETSNSVSSLAPALQELRVVLDRIEATLGAPLAAAEMSRRFATMNSITQRTRDLAQARFDTELVLLRNAVARLRTAMVALTGAIIAATLLAAFAFARLISRPMREITASINQLGRADLESPIQVSGPSDLQAIGVSLDWLRQRIGELEAQKSTFVRHMSHELKSPLANIRAGVDLLKEDGAAGGDMQEIAAIVERNATRLQRQIDDLLAYAGWQDVRPPQQPTTMKLHVLIDKVVADQAPAARARQIEVRANLQPLTLTGDEGQVLSMIDNLVGNAIKYSPDNGVVNLRLNKVDGTAIIEVEDTGPGIAENLRERVFEPFFRGPEAAAGSGTGTGIGLSLASAAAKAHGGEIEVLDSHGGARLLVTLPLDGGGH